MTPIQVDILAAARRRAEQRGAENECGRRFQAFLEEFASRSEFDSLGLRQLLLAIHSRNGLLEDPPAGVRSRLKHLLVRQLMLFRWWLSGFLLLRDGTLDVIATGLMREWQARTDLEKELRAELVELRSRLDALERNGKKA